MMNAGIWSEEEHDRFLHAIKVYPNGPWGAVAGLVGTRTVRQVQTHTQKYYEKIMRRMKGIRKDRKTWARLEHRIEDDILEFCKMMHGARISAEIANQLVGEVSMMQSRALSPTHEVKQQQVDESSPVVNIKSEPNDEGDEAFFELPSIEESLDFFIASLENDSFCMNEGGP
ncbi:Myb-like dna-binding protein, partial [Globisporangium splendens]